MLAQTCCPWLPVGLFGSNSTAEKAASQQGDSSVTLFAFFEPSNHDEISTKDTLNKGQNVSVTTNKLIIRVHVQIVPNWRTKSGNKTPF